MKASSRKSVLLVLRHSPYGSSLAKASLDVALASAAFEVPIDLLFLGDGVLQLIPHQDSHYQGKKNISRLLGSLPLYDINAVYVDSEAAKRYNVNLSMAPIPAKPLQKSEIHTLMMAYDHLLGF